MKQTDLDILLREGEGSHFSKCRSSLLCQERETFLFPGVCHLSSGKRFGQSWYSGSQRFCRRSGKWHRGKSPFHWEEHANRLSHWEVKARRCARISYASPARSHYKCCNAPGHRDYFEAGANVFVEIYDDRIEISNPGGLPKGLSKEELGTRSVRRNPLIADLLHQIALIEKAGIGIRRMIEDARRYKCPEPKFTVNGFFTTTFWPARELVRKITPQVGEQVMILKFCSTPRRKQEILAHLGLRPVYLNFKRHIQPLVEQGFLEMTIPDKPRSSKQCYRTTNLGHKALAQGHKI